MTDPVPRIITGHTIGPVDAAVAPRYTGEATFARVPARLASTSLPSRGTPEPT